jgi:Protein of unknown function (DUF2786)
MENSKDMEKIVNRVRKALALANDNPSDEEAHTAMLLAQKMLARHGLTLKDVEGEQEGLKKVVEKSVTEPSGRIPWWKKQLVMVIAENFKCKAFKSGKYQSTLVMFGLEEDVEIAEAVYKYAETIVDKLAKSYVGKLYRQGKSTSGVRNEYILGFLTGLRDKFEEQVAQNNWGLVLVTDALVEQHYSDKKLRKGSSGGIQPGFSGNAEARAEGYNQGKNFADSSSRKGIE